MGVKVSRGEEILINHFPSKNSPSPTLPSSTKILFIFLVNFTIRLTTLILESNVEKHSTGRCLKEKFDLLSLRPRVYGAISLLHKIACNAYN